MRCVRNPATPIATRKRNSPLRATAPPLAVRKSGSENAVGPGAGIFGPRSMNSLFFPFPAGLKSMILRKARWIVGAIAVG